ncbi:uncharacterized protein LOC118181018 isoform X2 [Stegodyphus dumicola]|uniref:uncharacterized protein LOC118181018 isoform X2 n=1 Tax=Stegodyphus dumicola TaxID=202533 RepID=UPI0015B0E93B|nr:uncharacterized protein LOC118181018 isoform X2 [Stegodyphus dumicola]
MSNSEENNDDFETFEMSQIFSDELGEEIWASQNISPESMSEEIPRKNTSLLFNRSISESLSAIQGNSFIPQLDGAFDEEFEKFGPKLLKEENHINPPVRNRVLEDSEEPPVLLPMVPVKWEGNGQVENCTKFSSEELDKRPLLEKIDSNISVCIPLLSGQQKSIHSNPSSSDSVCSDISKNVNSYVVKNTCKYSSDLNFDKKNPADEDQEEEVSLVVDEFMSNVLSKIEALSNNEMPLLEMQKHVNKEKYSSNALEHNLLEAKCSKSLAHQFKQKGAFIEHLRKLKCKVSERFVKRSTQDSTEILTNPTGHLSSVVLKNQKDPKETENNNNLLENKICDHGNDICIQCIDFSKIGREVVVLEKLTDEYVVAHKISHVNNVSVSITETQTLKHNIQNEIFCNATQPKKSHSKAYSSSKKQCNVIQRQFNKRNVDAKNKSSNCDTSCTKQKICLQNNRNYSASKKPTSVDTQKTNSSRISSENFVLDSEYSKDCSVVLINDQTLLSKHVINPGFEAEDKLKLTLGFEMDNIFHQKNSKHDSKSQKQNSHFSYDLSRQINSKVCTVTEQTSNHMESKTDVHKSLSNSGGKSGRQTIKRKALIQVGGIVLAEHENFSSPLKKRKTASEEVEEDELNTKKTQKQKAVKPVNFCKETTSESNTKQTSQLSSKINIFENDSNTVNENQGIESKYCISIGEAVLSRKKHSISNVQKRKTIPKNSKKKELNNVESVIDSNISENASMQKSKTVSNISDEKELHKDCERENNISENVSLQKRKNVIKNSEEKELSYKESQSDCNISGNLSKLKRKTVKKNSEEKELNNKDSQTGNNVVSENTFVQKKKSVSMTSDEKTFNSTDSQRENLSENLSLQKRKTVPNNSEEKELNNKESESDNNIISESFSVLKRKTVSKNSAEKQLNNKGCQKANSVVSENKFAQKKKYISKNSDEKELNNKDSERENIAENVRLQKRKIISKELNDKELQRDSNISESASVLKRKTELKNSEQKQLHNEDSEKGSSSISENKFVQKSKTIPKNSERKELNIKEFQRCSNVLESASVLKRKTVSKNSEGKQLNNKDCQKDNGIISENKFAQNRKTIPKISAKKESNNKLLQNNSNVLECASILKNKTIPANSEEKELNSEEAQKDSNISESGFSLRMYRSSKFRSKSKKQLEEKNENNSKLKEVKLSMSSDNRVIDQMSSSQSNLSEEKYSNTFDMSSKYCPYVKLVDCANLLSKYSIDPKLSMTKQESCTVSFVNIPELKPMQDKNNSSAENLFHREYSITATDSKKYSTSSVPKQLVVSDVDSLNRKKGNIKRSDFKDSKLPSKLSKSRTACKNQFVDNDQVIVDNDDKSNDVVFIYETSKKWNDKSGDANVKSHKILNKAMKSQETTHLYDSHSKMQVSNKLSLKLNKKKGISATVNQNKNELNKFNEDKYASFSTNSESDVEIISEKLYRFNSDASKSTSSGKSVSLKQKRNINTVDLQKQSKKNNSAQKKEKKFLYLKRKAVSGISSIDTSFKVSSLSDMSVKCKERTVKKKLQRKHGAKIYKPLRNKSKRKSIYINKSVTKSIESSSNSVISHRDIDNTDISHSYESSSKHLYFCALNEGTDKFTIKKNKSHDWCQKDEKKTEKTLTLSNIKEHRENIFSKKSSFKLGKLAKKKKKCSEERHASKFGENTTSSKVHEVNPDMCNEGMLDVTQIKKEVEIEDDFVLNSSPNVISTIKVEPIENDTKNSETSQQPVLKSSLRMKLKLKRILTRSNEPRIVVVGKELEGLDDDNSSDAPEDIKPELLPTSDASSPKIASLQTYVEGHKSRLKKSLGRRNLVHKSQSNVSRKFVSPLIISHAPGESNKFSKHEKEYSVRNKQNVLPVSSVKAKDNSLSSKYTPVYPTLSKDFIPTDTYLVETDKSVRKKKVKNKSTLNRRKKEEKCFSPVKKVSPLKNAASFKLDLKNMNESMQDLTKLTAVNHEVTDFKCNTVEIDSKVVKNQVSINSETTCYMPTESQHIRSFRLRSKSATVSSKSKVESLIRRNSLCVQNNFVSENGRSSGTSDYCKLTFARMDSRTEELNEEVTQCQPCAVAIKRLSSDELDKYLYKMQDKKEHLLKDITKEPQVLSVPSPVIDQKIVSEHIKGFDNLFNFPTACNSPLKYKLDASPRINDNDKSMDSVYAEPADPVKQDFHNIFSGIDKVLKKPSEVFSSVEREDMGVLWNLSYLSPPAYSSVQGSPPCCFSPEQEKDYEKHYETDCKYADKIKPSNYSDSISLPKQLSPELDMNTSSAMNQCDSSMSPSMSRDDCESHYSSNNVHHRKEHFVTSCNNSSFRNLFSNLESNTSNNISFSLPEDQNVNNFKEQSCMGHKTISDSSIKDIKNNVIDKGNFIPADINPMPQSDFEKTLSEISKETVSNVRILDFQEFFFENDNDMNLLLNDPEIPPLTNLESSELYPSDINDKENVKLHESTKLDLLQSFPEKSSHEFIEPLCNDFGFKREQSNVNIVPKEKLPKLETDIICNTAIITAADTSSVLVSSYKNNTVPVLAVNKSENNPICFNEYPPSDFESNNLFPVLGISETVNQSENYFGNSSSIVISETPPNEQDCTNFFEGNDLLQSCSVSSTSDIDAKVDQSMNVLENAFSGEEDILSMIVKSCDIGEEFDVNLNSNEITDNTLEIIDSGSEKQSGFSYEIIENCSSNESIFQINRENAVTSSSQNNGILAQKLDSKCNSEINPITKSNFSNVEHHYSKNNDVLCTQKSEIEKSSQNIEIIEDTLEFASMIHSFYGDDPLYGLNSSINSGLSDLHNLSWCSDLQTSNISEETLINSSEERTSQNISEVRNSGSSNNIYFSKSSYNLLESLLQSNKSASEVKATGAIYNNRNSFNSCTVIPKSNDKIEKCSASDINSSFSEITETSSKVNVVPTIMPPSRAEVEEWLTLKSIGLDSPSKFKESLKEIGNDSLDSDSSNSTETFSELDTSDGNICHISFPFHNSNKSLRQNDVTKLHFSPEFVFHSSNTNKSHLNTPLSYKQSSVIKMHSCATNYESTPRSTKKCEKSLPFDLNISPINNNPLLIRDNKERKRKLSFMDLDVHPKKTAKAPEEIRHENKTHAFKDWTEKLMLNKTMDTSGNLTYSQIEGPTLENTGGYKVNIGDSGNMQVRHEIQHLTVMSLEVHVNTRNDLLPDPKFDAVAAIFFCICNDIGVNEQEEVVGIIVNGQSFLTENSQSSMQKVYASFNNCLLLTSSNKNCHVFCVESESLLFEKLASIVMEWDPDILIGYEIQMASWGYLTERAQSLNMNLNAMLSRVIDKKESKIVHVEHDHTVTDQTADLSEISICGRIVLNVWRLIRKEITLNVYTFENVYYHVLHRRTPLYTFRDLTRWFLGSQKEKVIHYYSIRVRGCLQFLEKLDIIGRTSELARLFGIQFYEVLSRGSQFRVESMMLRTAAPLSYIPVSPSVHQRSHARAPECVPLILEPESRFYIDPVVVLDFQSLYPSMVIAYNYCFSTCLGRVEHFGKNVPFEFGCTSLNISDTTLHKLQNDIHISPTGIAFVKSNIRRGILPVMLEEILKTRVMVKQSMKKVKDNVALKKLLDARQLGLKLIANVTYGYTGASFSGRMPSVEVADSIVGKARETLERAIQLIENTPEWKAKVVYGDTDSLFILLPGRSKDEAFKLGQEIADAVTSTNPKPVKLKFEKVYLPCVLETKKRYVGFMYETADQKKPVFDAKGIETVRRDSCPATAKILEKSLKILFETYDVDLVKKYVQKQFSKLLNGQASLIDCIFAKEYRGISGYRPGACVPALEIAKKRLSRDPRSEPRVGERVPYVVVYGFPGLPIIQLVHEPIDLLNDISLRINATYYITRVISPPLERVFSLIDTDVKSWYSSLARTFKPTLPMLRPVNQQRGTISQYFATLSCPVCEKPTFSSMCDSCREDLQTTTVTLNDKIRQWERTADHLKQEFLGNQF